MTSLLQALGLTAALALHGIVLVWGYHFLYRLSPTAASKVELEWFIPAVVPMLMFAWWLLGIVDAFLNSGFIPNHLWVWWMPIGALTVLWVGVLFARWNRSRLIKKRKFQP
jgi:hypothetical protein